MSNTKLAKWGLVLMMIGFVFAVIETLYFGSNYWPESTKERMCDIIATVICGVGMAMFMTSVIRWVKQNN